MKKSLLGKILQNHSLAMILCCAIPLALIVILSLTGTLGSWGFYAVMLLCPLLHIVMMRGMRGHGPSAHDKKGDGPSADDMKGLIASPVVAEDPQKRINEESE